MGFCSGPPICLGSNCDSILVASVCGREIEVPRIFVHALNILHVRSTAEAYS